MSSQVLAFLTCLYIKSIKSVKLQDLIGESKQTFRAPVDDTQVSITF